MEREEVVSRITALTEEQMEIAVKILPDTLLWNELIRRYYDNQDGIKRVKEALTLPTQALP
jgi:hypothetical protein